MGAAPAPTSGREEPLVRSNRAVTAPPGATLLLSPRARGDGKGTARAAQPQPLFRAHEAGRRSSRAAEAVAATLFKPCGSLIYLANSKSADGFTLENLISGSIDPHCAADLEKLQSRVNCITITTTCPLPLAGEQSGALDLLTQQGRVCPLSQQILAPFSVSPTLLFGF